MKRASVIGLAVVIAAMVLMGDSTANARERGGRRARKQRGEQQSYSTWSQPTRVVDQFVPTNSTDWRQVPPANLPYAPTQPYASQNGNSVPDGYPNSPAYPINASYPMNLPAPATPRETTITITPTSPEHTAGLVELIQALRAAGYVK